MFQDKQGCSSGSADDKGIYYFIPHMIKYYLDKDGIYYISNG